MPNGPSRRQLLGAAAASSIVAPIAGCLSTFDADDDPAGSTGDTKSDDESSPHESACDVGRTLITALGAGDFEAAASYYPYEHLVQESVDEASLVEDFENGDWSPFGWVEDDGEIREITCECAEPYQGSSRADLEADVTGDVGEALELRYAVAYDANGERATDSAFVNAVEIDGDWFAVISYRGDHDRCGTGTADEREDDIDSDDDGDAEKKTAQDQPLEAADWADVDEIVLEARVPGWVGLEPAPIEGVENPTLLLFEGREYAIEWRNGDGVAHNLKLRDENGEALASTDVTADESASLAIEAAPEMVDYVCEPHRNVMRGRLEVRSE